MSGSTELVLGALRREVRELRDEVRRGVKQRKVIWIVAFALVIAGATLTYLVASLYYGRNDSRQFYNEQIHMLDIRTTKQVRDLACLVPPGTDFANRLRQQYHCGTYHKPKPLPRPSVSTTTRTVTNPGAARVAPTTSTVAPTASPSVRSSAARRPHASGTPKATPKATPTRTAQPTPRRTPTASPSATPTTTDRPILCGLLGTLICRTEP